MAWIAGIVVIALLLACVWLYPAQRFLQQYRRALLSPDPSWKGTRTTIDLPQGPIAIDTYISPGTNPQTTLLLFPGLHPAGIDDPRFIGFARCVANSGFRAVTIDIPGFRKFEITADTIDLMEQLIQANAQKYQDLGVLGISYGAGPLFVALSRPSIRNKVRFAVSIGGYYSLSHAVEFNLTGIHQKNARREPHPWGRLIFAYQHLNELALGADSALLKESLWLRLNLKEKEAEAIEKDMSPETRTFLAELLGTLSQPTLENFRRIFQSHNAEAMALSPESVVTNLDRGLHVYLLHGSGDSSVPFEETGELAAALRKAGVERVRDHVTDVLTHVDTTRSSEIFDSLQLLWWTRTLLSEARINHR